MTTIKPAIERILRLFYENKSQKFHLREIARRTGLYGQSITRYLEELEKDKILISNKEGNLRNYVLGKSKKVFALLAFFDIERFEKLPSIRKSAIRFYLNNLKEKPVLVILFGSTAKETFKESSDIDLLIITNQKISAKEAEKEAYAVTSIKISTFQMTYPHFQKELKLKEDAVVQSALFSGYPIYNPITYYEEVNHEGI